MISAYGPGERRTLADGVEKVIINLVEDAERTVSEAAEALRKDFNLTITATVAHGNPADVLCLTKPNNARLASSSSAINVPKVRQESWVSARSVISNASCDVYVANTRLG